MGLIFVHDHFFLKCNGKYYSGSLTAEVIQRYIEIFENITFVTRGKDVTEVQDEKSHSSIEGTKFVRVPNFKGIFKLQNINLAKKAIENEVAKADFVIARTSTMGNIAVKYAQKYKKPYLIEVVSCSWDASWNYSLLGKIIAPFAFILQKKIVKDAPYALYVTNEFLQHRYPTKGKSINCSDVALTEFSDAVLEKRVEKIGELNKDNSLIIGTIAAVNVRYKGQQYVIEALGKLKSQGITNFEYHLVGAGNQQYLKKVAERNGVVGQIKFLGSMPHDKVFEWLESIDIYIQPSRQEGMPRALIEAMSRGLFAVGAKTAGIPELLEQEYIFSNTRHNIDEICTILKSLTMDVMLAQAKRNFEEAKKYEKEIVETRRQKFYLEFLSEGTINSN